MNILYLPENIASIQASTAKSINKIQNVNAKSLVFSLHKYQTITDEVIHIPKIIDKKRPIKYINNFFTFDKKIKRLFEWADVLHYVWGPIYPDGREFEWKEAKGKKIFVEWVGSDIRNPEILIPINPYYKNAFNDNYEHRELELNNISSKKQEIMQAVGAIPTIWPEMSLYLKPNLFQKTLPLLPRIEICKEIKPDNLFSKKIPLIVHSPSAPYAKGSNYIIDTINKLKKNGYKLIYLPLHRF